MVSPSQYAYDVFVPSKKRHPEGLRFTGLRSGVLEICVFETPCYKCLWSRSTKNQELVLLDRDKKHVSVMIVEE